MNSTWLLLSMYRKWTSLALAIAFVVSFLLMYLTAWSNSHGLMTVTGMAAFMLTGLTGEPPMWRHNSESGSFQWSFPVTLYQRAWLPFPILLAVWLAGISGGSLGLFLSSSREVGMLGYLASIAYAFPGLLFCAVFLYCAGIPACCIVFFPLSWIPHDIATRRLFELAMSAYPHTWPLYIILTLLYIIERPIRLSATDRRGNLFWGAQNMDAPFRYRTASVATGVITRGIFVAVWTPICIDVMLKPETHPFLFATGVIILGLFIHLTRDTFRRARLQGFRLLSALGLYILRASMVFAPVAYWIGLEQSPLEKCGGCGSYKFLYNPVCSRCNTVAPREAANDDNKEAASYPHRVAIRIAGAAAVPLVVGIILFALTGSHVQSLIRVETTIDLSGMPDPDKAVSDTCRALEKASMEVAIPGRYRVETIRSSTTSLTIAVYGLRWKSPADAARTLLEKALPETAFRLSKNDSCEVKYFLNPFLDNKVHHFDRIEDNFLTPVFGLVGLAPQKSSLAQQGR